MDAHQPLARSISRRCPNVAVATVPRGDRRSARAGRRALAVAAGLRRLVEGRARDQRHDGRRGHAAARVPRDPRAARRPRARPAGSAPSSAPTAPGATSTAVPRTSRRRSRRTSRCGSPATRPQTSTCGSRREYVRGAGGSAARARVHAHLAGAVRRLALGARCRRCRPS